MGAQVLTLGNKRPANCRSRTSICRTDLNEVKLLQDISLAVNSSQTMSELARLSLVAIGNHLAYRRTWLYVLSTNASWFDDAWLNETGFGIRPLDGEALPEPLGRFLTELGKAQEPAHVWLDQAELAPLAREAIQCVNATHLIFVPLVASDRLNGILLADPGSMSAEIADALKLRLADRYGIERLRLH